MAGMVFESVFGFSNDGFYMRFRTVPATFAEDGMTRMIRSFKAEEKPTNGVNKYTLSMMVQYDRLFGRTHWLRNASRCRQDSYTLDSI